MLHDCYIIWLNNSSEFLNPYYRSFATIPQRRKFRKTILLDAGLSPIHDEYGYFVKIMDIIMERVFSAIFNLSGHTIFTGTCTNL